MPVSTGVSAKTAVMTAAIAMLNVASFLALCPAGAFDDVPQGAAMPYARVETRELSTLSTFGALNFLVEVRLHIFSQYEGTKQADDITASAAALLHHQSHDVSSLGWAIGQIDYQSAFDAPALLVSDVRTGHRVAVFQAQMVQA